MSKKFSPAAAGIVMYITKYFLWTNGEIKTAIFYMSSHLKQIFASQNFLGGERYVFLFDALVGRIFFQGVYPLPGKKNMTPLAPKVFDPSLAILAVSTYE